MGQAYHQPTHKEDINKMTKPVRIRFAPSPTGHLHVGGARTAIFNWLFARKLKGTFILRIEDTDVSRSTQTSEQTLLEDLRWLGLDWDEGPEKGGPHEPYRQSERLTIYDDKANQLVKQGIAYPCFCSEEELETKRQAAIAKNEAPQYDGTCRNLTPEEIASKRQAKRPEVIRFQVPAGSVTIHDLIRGDIEMETSMVGDFIIRRSNGLPTYNFAAVVDDHSMEITHVLRGEEHLPNTLRQILIYQAMQATPPKFGHLPLILGEDRSKLSKRHGASSVGELRDTGFLPTGVVNYLVLLGWSHSKEKEVLAIDELIDDFNLKRVNKSAAVFDKTKLRWMNGMHIRGRDAEALFAMADPYFPDNIKEVYSEEQRREIFALLHERIDTFCDLEQQARIFIKPPIIDDEAKECLAAETSKQVIHELKNELDQGEAPLTPEIVKTTIKQISEKTGVRGKELYFPIRAAITGSVHGPDIARVMTIKGKNELMKLL
jgi:nondiscriminating glutamyl-tRNA synthetase